MPKPKPIATVLGNGRGSFRKALLSVFMEDLFEENALDIAIEVFGEKCIYCGRSVEKNRLQADFLWPQSKGGLHVKGNVVPACPTCNSDRGSKPWQEFLNKKFDEKISKSQKDEMIKKINEFIANSEKGGDKDIEDVLTEENIKLRNDVDTLLNALSEGIRIKINKPQIKDVKFDNAGQMFDELVSICKKYSKSKCENNIM
ncbi:MAG TPA: HNH endonuclease [Spirochaetota bacterium]|nr:HNH endonuclease [Spirochaetota bacterium]HPR49522.1 HNH endonuclease [Spirochaetota bacterium]